MGRRWGDHRDWPMVPDEQLALLRDDAQVQVERAGKTWIDRLWVVGDELPGMSSVEDALSAWAERTVTLATSSGVSASHDRARAQLVQWGTMPGRRWPDEAWWWSPCGLACVAWSGDGWWEQRSNGAVRQYVRPSVAAEHLPVSNRTVRRWGENRKRVRQHGTVATDRTRTMHRTDLAQLVVMRYSLIFR